MDGSSRGHWIDAFLKALNLKRNKVPGKGSCLFGSIAKGLNALGKVTPQSSKQYTSASVRQTMHQWVQSNPTFVFTPDHPPVWVWYLNEFYQEDDDAIKWGPIKAKAFFTEAFAFTAAALSLSPMKKEDPVSIDISQITNRRLHTVEMQSAFVHRLFTLLMQRLMDLKCWYGNSLELAGDLHDRIKIYLKLDISEVAVLSEELVVDFETVWKLFKWRCCICCCSASPAHKVNFGQVDAANMLVRLPGICDWKNLHQLVAPPVSGSSQGQVGSKLEESRQLANEYMDLAGGDNHSFHIRLRKSDSDVDKTFVIGVLLKTVSDFEKPVSIMRSRVTEKDLAELRFARDLMTNTEHNPAPEVQTARQALNTCITTLSVKHMLQHHKEFTKDRKWGGDLDLRVAAEVLRTCIKVHNVAATEDVNWDLSRQAKKLKRYTVTCTTETRSGTGKFPQVIQMILSEGHYDHVESISIPGPAKAPSPGATSRPEEEDKDESGEEHPPHSPQCSPEHYP